MATNTSKRSSEPANPHMPPGMDAARALPLESEGPRALVFNHHKGPFHIKHLVPAKSRMSEPERYDPIVIRFMPGLNVVSAAWIKICRELNSAFDRKFQENPLEDLGGLEGFRKLRERDAIRMVAGSASTSSLQALADGEKRLDVIRAIEDELAAFKAGQAAQDDVRREERRAKRRGR